MSIQDHEKNDRLRQTIAELEHPVGEAELVEKLAKLLHHYLSAAQNIPENDGTGCCDCGESTSAEFLPIIRQYVQAQLTAALERKFPPETQLRFVTCTRERTTGNVYD